MPTKPLPHLELKDVTPAEAFTPEPGKEDFVFLPDGNVLRKKKLSGRDFFEFQRALLPKTPGRSGNGIQVDAIDGMKQLMLKMFVFVDPQTYKDDRGVTIDDLEDEEGLGFQGVSILSEHLTSLFQTGRQGRTLSLPPKQ